MAMFCTECGSSMKDDASFCVECGAPVRIPAGKPTVPDTTSEPAMATMPSTRSKTPKASLNEALDKDQIHKAVVRTLLAWLAVFITVGVIAAIASLLASNPEAGPENSVQLPLFGLDALWSLTDNPGKAISVPTVIVGGAVTFLLGLGGQYSIVDSTDGGTATSVYQVGLLIVPLLAATFLLLTHKKTIQSLEEKSTSWHGLVVGVASLPFVVVAWALTRGSMAYGQQSVSTSFLAPLILAFIIGWLVGGGYRSFPRWMNTDWGQEVKDALQSLVGVARVFLPVALVAAAFLLIFQGLAIGSDASSAGPVFIIGYALSLLLYLPNLVASTAFGILGSPLGFRLNPSDTGGATIDSVGIPIWMQLIVLVVIVVILLARIGKGTSRSSIHAWWIHAIVFGIVGLLVSVFISYQFHKESISATGVETSETRLLGFNLFDSTLRFAVLGALIGLATHPEVERYLSGIGHSVFAKTEPLVTRLAKIGSTLQSKLGMQKDAQLEADPGLLNAIRSLPGWVYGPVLAMIGIGVLAFVAIPIGSAIIHNNDTPESALTKIEDSLKNGNADEFVSLAEVTGPIATTSGVENVTHELQNWDEANPSESTNATLTWTTKDRQGAESQGTANFSLQQKDLQQRLVMPNFSEAMWGAAPQWRATMDDPQEGQGLPQARVGWSADQSGEDFGEVQLDVAGIKGAVVTFMPGTASVTAQKPADSPFTYKNADTELTAATGSNSVIVEVTVPSRTAEFGKVKVVDKLKNCTSDSGADCPITNFCTWVDSPATSAFEATATGTKTMEIAATRSFAYRAQAKKGNSCAKATRDYKFPGESFSVESNGDISAP